MYIQNRRAVSQEIMDFWHGDSFRALKATPMEASEEDPEYDEKTKTRGKVGAGANKKGPKHGAK